MADRRSAALRSASSTGQLAGPDEAFAIVVEATDRAETEDLADRNGEFPASWVHLLIEAFAILVVPTGTVSAVHAILTLAIRRIAMITVTSLICLRVFAAAPSLALDFSGFQVVSSAGRERIAFHASSPGSRKVVMVVRNKHYAVWDKRGLTVRFGSFVRTTSFDQFPTSPKFFSKEEIAANLAGLRRRDLTRSATALSGHALIGSSAYFLVRWRLRSGETWFEALIQVDLSAKVPEPRAVEREVGASFAEGFIDDRLLVLGDRLGVIARTGKTWGLSVFKPGSGAASFVPLGEGLAGYRQLSESTVGYAEDTSVGTKRVGLVNLIPRARRELLESRDFDHLLPSPGPLVAEMAHGSTRALRTLGSGAEIVLPPNSGVWRCQAGVIVGWPREKPAHAILYDPVAWSILAKTS